MQIIKPHTFEEALEKLGAQSPIGSKLNTEEWRAVPLALRDNAFFSATIENVRFLQKSKDFIGDFLTAARDESGALAAGGRAQFVKEMSAFAVSQGMGPLDPEDAGGLKDITSQARLSLIYNTKVQQAQGYGYYKQGLDPHVLDSFPASRFIRVVDVTTPRPLHQRHEGEVHLKGDPFWVAMNEDFGVPWPPFGYGSGMGIEDVERGEAEQLGLIAPGERLPAVDKGFNDQLQASTAGLDAGMKDQLRAQFNDQIEIDEEEDVVRWKQKRKGAQT